MQNLTKKCLTVKNNFLNFIIISKARAGNPSVLAFGWYGYNFTETHSIEILLFY